jgi:hypothetical protein
MSKDEPKKKLVGPWRDLHGAIWLIGLAILFWRGWIWPGILILIALSTILEIVIMRMVPDSYEVEPPKVPAPPQMPVPPQPPQPFAASTETPVVHHPEQLPTNCPKCGAPARGHEVKWTGPYSADCSFCGANLPMSK